MKDAGLTMLLDSVSWLSKEAASRERATSTRRDAAVVKAAFNIAIDRVHVKGSLS